MSWHLLKFLVNMLVLVYILKSSQRHNMTRNNFLLLVPNQILKYLYRVNKEIMSNLNFEQLLL